MLSEAAQFIQEKLSKKYLSPNTIRDGIMAAFLVLSETSDASDVDPSESAAKRKEMASDFRQKTHDAFQTIQAPFEYPTLAQLKQVKLKLEEDFDWAPISDAARQQFQYQCEAFFSRF